RVVIAAILVWAGYGYLGASFAFAFSMGSGVVLAVYIVWKFVPEAFFIPSWSNLNIDEVFRFSWPLMAASLFGMIVGQVDTLMLQFFRGSSQVGLYQAAFPFAYLLTVGGSMFGSIFLSNASRMVGSGNEGELGRVYRTVTKWIAVFTVPLFVIFMAFPEAVLLLFGKQYTVVEDVLRVLSFGFLVSSVVGPFGNVFQALDRTKLNMALTGMLAMLNFVLNAVLIPQLGAMGAAVATTVSYLIYAGAGVAVLYWLFDIVPFKLLVWKVWFGAAIAALFVYLISNTLFVVTPFWFFVVDLVLFGLLYLILLLVLRTLDEDDLLILRAVKRKTGRDIPWIEGLIRRFS
ncbi:MAG: polysaccharide biosynthesis C-terminal domain-containing protein, partial [Candidatus Nanohaloarchaea archaeon]|nr:polysaccharide biosynthesis C-terminal domain-containing protein [Candidatus Nanohaloarchaea archaeon]